MSVNLERLREAQDDFLSREETSVATMETLEEAADAVLNSPTVWWCVEYLIADTPGCHTSEFHGCGWRVLVPVVGP